MSEFPRSDDWLQEMARFFYALKDPLRMRILVVLSQAGELTVSELVRAVRVSQPLVSWHLRRLRNTNLVRVKREGRTALYSVNLELIEGRLAAFRALLVEALDERA
jgi:ArsR family transcriptional regulator